MSQRTWKQPTATLHLNAHSHTARQRASKTPHHAGSCRTSTRVAALQRTLTCVDVRQREAWCVMMRRDASKTPQKSIQFWFLRYVTHVNARRRALCERALRARKSTTDIMIFMWRIHCTETMIRCRCEFDDWRLHVACMLQPVPFPEQYVSALFVIMLFL